MVDIRAIENPVKVLRYIFKYTTKSPTIDTQAHRDEYNAVLRGKRLVQPFGSWYGRVTVRKEPFACATCGLTAWRVEWDLTMVAQAWFEMAQQRGP